MTGSATQGIKAVLHPVSDLATARAVYTGRCMPGMTSPVAYWHVPDIEAKRADVTAGATVTDPDGNVLGLLQDR